MMRRLFLFVALSLFYTSAMVVVGGYNVSSDAAQLWNSQRDKNDSSSGSSYYNQNTPSNKSGKSNLFNGGKGGASIHRKDDKGDRMAYEYLKYDNRQRTKNRTPAVFAYMSPYSVANRLNNIDMALMRQSERKKETAKLLRVSRADSEKYDYHKFKRENKAKLFSRVASATGRKKHKKDNSKGKARTNKSSNSGTSSSYTSSSSLGTSSSQVFNSSGSSAGSGKKTTLFNSSN